MSNIADEPGVASALDRVQRALPPVVGLLNIAGVSSPIGFGELTTAEWDRVFAINVRGTYFVTRAVVPAMIEAGLGRIVTVSSVSAQRGGGIYGAVPYSASKAALLGFTRALARELGPHGITVNAIAPGSVDTDIMGGELPPQRRAELTAPRPGRSARDRRRHRGAAQLPRGPGRRVHQRRHRGHQRWVSHRVSPPSAAPGDAAGGPR